MITIKEVKEITIKEHYELKQKLLNSKKDLWSIYLKLQRQHGKSHRMCKSFFNILKTGGIFSKTFIFLENDFGKKCDSKEWRKYLDIREE